MCLAIRVVRFLLIPSAHSTFSPCTPFSNLALIVLPWTNVSKTLHGPFFLHTGTSFSTHLLSHILKIKVDLCGPTLVFLIFHLQKKKWQRLERKHCSASLEVWNFEVWNLELWDRLNRWKRWELLKTCVVFFFFLSYVCICTTHVTGAFGRPGKCVGSPRTEVTDGAEPPCRHWEPAVPSPLSHLFITIFISNH